MVKSESISKGLLSSSTAQVVAKVCGLLRSTLTAVLFGAGFHVDTYNVANAIVMVVFLIGGESFSYAGVPRLSRQFARNQTDAFGAFTRSLFIIALALASVGWLVTEVAFPYIASGVAAGYTHDEHHTLLVTTRLMIPGCIFFLAGKALGASLNASKNYSIFAMSEAIASVAMLSSLFFLRAAPYSLSVSFTCGQAAGFIFLFLKSCKLLHTARRFRLRAFWRDVRYFSGVALSYLAMCALHPIFLFFEKRYGLQLGTGVLAALGYAQLVSGSISSLPSFGTVFFPKISVSLTQETFNQILKVISCYAIPASIFTFVFSYSITDAIFGYGKMTSPEVLITANFLAVLSVVVFFGAYEAIILRFLYAANMTRNAFVGRLLSYVVAVVSLLIMHDTLMPRSELAIYSGIFSATSAAIFFYVFMTTKKMRIESSTVMHAIVLSALSFTTGMATKFIANTLGFEKIVFLVFSFVVYSVLTSGLFLVVSRDPLAVALKQRLAGGLGRK